MKTRWEWIYENPSLASKFYKNIICTSGSKPPSDKELLHDLKYRGFKNAISKLNPPITITDIRKELGFREKTENTTSIHAHSKEIVSFLKNKFYGKPWRIEDYKNITSEEQLKIRVIAKETTNCILQKHPEHAKFHNYTKQALYNLIKAVPLILSEEYKNIVLFIQLYQLCYGKFNAIMGNDKFTKLIKLFYGKDRNKIPFQKRRDEIYIFGRSIFDGLPYFNEFSFLEKKLIKYPNFLKYLKEAKSIGTFPLKVLTDIRRGHEFQRISRFARKLTNISKSHNDQRNIKFNFVKKLISEKKIRIFYPNCDNPILIENLMEFCQEKYYNKVIHSHGSLDHKYILPKLLSILPNNVIGIEIPVWMKSHEIYLTGHIDLLLFHDNTMIIADYKPDLTSELIKGKVNTSFLNSIPQVISYALLLKNVYHINDIMCITFNKKGVWLYNPVDLFYEIKIFLSQNNKQKELDRPWEKFFEEFINYSDSS